MKKILSLIMAVVMMATVLTGCTKDELSYLELNKEISQTNAFEATVLVGVNADVIFDYFLESAKNKSITMTEEERQLVANFKEYFKNNNLSIDMQFDLVNTQFLMSVKAKGKTTVKEQNITTLIFKDNKLYFNVYDLINFMSDNKIIEKDAIVNGDVANKKYIVIDVSQDASISEEIKRQFTTNYTATKNLSIKLIDFMSKGVFNNYQTNKVKKVNANKYEVALTGSDVYNMLFEIAEYGINNFDSISKSTIEFVEGLTDEEYRSLNLEKLYTKEQLVENVKQTFAGLKTQISSSKEIYLAALKLTKSNIEKDDKYSTVYKPMLDGFSMKQTLEKTGVGQYKETDKLSINANPIIKFALENQKESNNIATVEVLNKLLAKQNIITIEATSTLKKLDKANIVAPTENIVSFEEFKKILKQKITVNIDNGLYTNSVGGFISGEPKGTMNIEIVNDSSYLPMRQLSEMAGEEVGFDDAKKSAYIVRANNEFIYLGGIIINDRTYIKVRELEKAGYKVTWNEQTREVEISK